MLSLLGSAELIVKASEEASASRATVGVPHGMRGVGARCAPSLPLLGAGASSSALVRSGGAAQPGGAPTGGGSGRAAVFSCAPPAVALLTLAPRPRAQSQPWKIVGFSIYGFTLVSLFMCSTLHHGLEGPPAMERGLRIADYCAIYPLIAGARAGAALALPARGRSRALAARPGTFTPICLVFLYNSGVGWAIWGTLWFLTGCGIALTVSAFDHLPKCGAPATLCHVHACKHACARSRAHAGGCR